MSEFPSSSGQRSLSSFQNETPPRSVDRSRSARCSPGLRRRRLALNHCSPKGRLRLIQFLQELDLDKALHSLPDECTLEDLLPISTDAFTTTFQDNLDAEEMEKLWQAIQSHGVTSRSPRSPAPTYRSRRVGFLA